MTDKKTVYVYNMSEDVWPFISAISNPQKRQFEISENANLCDRELFSNINEKHLVFISPQLIAHEFIEYFKKISEISTLELLVPKKHSGQICEDIIKDNVLFQRLVELGKSSELVFKSYSASPQFYNLLNVLKTQHIEISIPESPSEEDSWTVNFYGTKAGIRQTVNQLFQNNSDMVMPIGYICEGIDTGSRIAASWYTKHRKVVLKTNKGHSGTGVLIYPKGSLPDDYSSCREIMLQTLRQDEYWSKFPIIIEDYVDVDTAIGGGFPNLEFRILEDGTVKYLYQCGMRISKEGAFMGVEIHDSIFPKNVLEKMLDIGETLGSQYAKDGYRGNFDIDFAAGEDGKYYINESNIRRTGGTYVYETAKKLSGENFLHDSYVLSTNVYKLPENNEFTFNRIIDILSSVHYSSQTKEGVIIASTNLLQQGSMAYIVIGKSKQRALEIEDKMKQLLHNL